MRRRMFLAGVAALAATPSPGHTPYGQWVFYRRKHLMIGSHRQDMATWELATAVVQDFEHDLSEASARVARAPRPERLASLIATDQMDLAVLHRDTLPGMVAGTGAFLPYGPQPLRLIGQQGAHRLIAHARIPDRHAWLLAYALDSGGRLALPGTGPDLPPHPGVLAYLSGADVPPADAG